MSESWTEMPSPRAFRYASFSVQYDEKPVVPAVALGLDVGGLGRRTVAWTTRRSRPARRCQIFHVDADVASAASAQTTRPELCARLKRSGVVRRGDFRTAVRTLAPAPAAGRDAERPADQLARHHAAEQEHLPVRVEAIALEARALVAAAATSSARATARRIRRQRSGVRVPDATRRRRIGHDAGGGIAIVWRGSLVSASRLSIMSTACVFPGQGSQSKGMGAELFDRFPDWTGRGRRDPRLFDSRAVRRRSAAELGPDAVHAAGALRRQCDDVSRADATTARPRPHFVAGHSLGEYNALLAAGVFDFATGLRLVKRRGD